MLVAVIDELVVFDKKKQHSSESLFCTFPRLRVVSPSRGGVFRVLSVFHA